MPALGRGGLTRTHDVSFDRLLPRTDGLGSGVAAAASRDFWWGFSPPVPVKIPYTWLSRPFRSRADRPITNAAVSRTNAGTAYATNTAGITSFGHVAATTGLDTAQNGDPQSLANWLITYYASPRMRCPSLTINLFGPDRSDYEKWRVLGVTIGTRIQITGAPATWPEGITSLIVEGIVHQIGQAVRTVIWTTSPVIGATPGTAGPWFRLNGGSNINGADAVPF